MVTADEDTDRDVEIAEGVKDARGLRHVEDVLEDRRLAKQTREVWE